MYRALISMVITSLNDAIGITTAMLVVDIVLLGVVVALVAIDMVRL